MMRKRLHVTLFASQPHGKAAKTQLWAFGVAALADAASCSVFTVRREIERGKVDPGCFASIFAWIGARNSKPKGEIQ